MAFPRDRFEVAWTAAPWDDDPFWVDVTPWLLGIGRERGRQPRDTVNRATKLTARLDNRTGRFTMQNGPAVTNLVPEAGSTGWTIGSTGDTVVLHGGWLRATRNGAAGSLLAQSPQVPVVAGTTYRFRALPRNVTTARLFRIQVSWLPVAIGSISGSVLETDAGDGLTFTATAPAGATSCVVLPEWQSVATGESHDVTLVAMAATTEAFPPYWPNVEPRRPCRWQTDHNGVTYDRFEGLLEALPTAWTDFGDEQATFTAAGRLAAAADVDLPGSVWETTMRDLAPTNWWRLDDPESVVQFSDSGSAGKPAVIRSNPGGGTIDGGQPGSGQSSKFIPGQARTFDATWAKITPGVVTGSGDWTVAVIARLDFTRPQLLGTEDGLFNGEGVNLWTVLDASNAELIAARYANFYGYFLATDPPVWESTLSVSGAAVAAIAYENSAGNPNQYRTDLLRHDWFSVVVRRTGNTVDLFINGVREGTTPWTGSIAGAQFILGENGLPGENGPVELDEAAAWSRALTDAEVVALDGAFRTPWQGDTTHRRYDRFPALTGIPSTRMVHGAAAADAGATLGPTHLAGKALTYLHRLARSVRGRVLDTVDGNIELRTGGDLLSRRTSAATFGQQPGDLPYQQVTTDPSFERIVTVARAKNVDGAVQETVADDLVPGSSMTYVARYGRRGPTEGEIGDLLLADDRQADDFTSWLVNAGKRPDVALDPLVLHPLGDDAVTVQCLSLDLDDVITVRKKHPAQTQTVTAVVRVAGINETVSINGRKRTWDYALRLEPLDPTPYILADGASLADGTHIAY